MSVNKTASLKAYTVSIANGDTWGDDPITFDNIATSLTIVPASGSGDLSVRVDNDPDSEFVIPAGQAFKSSAGDFQCTYVDFSNTSGSTITVQVLAGISN